MLRLQNSKGYTEEKSIINSKPNVRYLDGGIRKYDGYLGDPIWVQPENYSTYYNREVDSQCRIPSRSLDELRQELGLSEGDKIKSIVKR